MPKVTMIPATINPMTHLPKETTQKRRVAGYARVSTDSDEQFTSYEVPQYYVEGSHPAIIAPDEWDHVRAEFARRKALGNAYSGKSVFSAKLVCEDCGGCRN